MCGREVDLVLDTTQAAGGAAGARRALMEGIDALLARAAEGGREDSENTDAGAPASQLVTALSRALCLLHARGAAPCAAPAGSTAEEQIAEMHAVRAAARAGAGIDAGARARARAQSGARSGAGAGARGRIVVLNGLPDAPQHYVALTNAVFSAQKAYIPVDALALDVNTPSPYLQVAAKVTGGSYSQRPGEGRGLLEALLCVAGADLHSRRFLAAPPAPAVDFRPVDFVTKEPVDVGYVCSVCLSVFGERVARCPTCGTEYREDGTGEIRIGGGGDDSAR
eukprot:PRCOL_00005856-RA